MALGDRRSRVRLEVVGALWATLELTEPARVVNISREGALITSPVPMPPESVQPLSANAPARAMAEIIRPLLRLMVCSCVLCVSPTG